MEKEIVVYIKNQQDWNNALQVLEDNGGYKRTWGSQICFRGERPTAMQITDGWTHCGLSYYQMYPKKYHIISYEDFMEEHDKLDRLNHPVRSFPCPDGSDRVSYKEIKNVRKVKVIKNIPSEIKYQGRSYILK